MDAIETILSHQSVRNYKDERISDEALSKIEDAIIQTSSSCFLQIVSTIVVTDQDKLATIAKFSGEQEHIAKCSHFLMFCLDMTKLQKVADFQPPYSFKMLFMGLNDCSLACQNALIATEAQGLGGVIIGGYKNNIQGVSDLLKLPKGVVPLIGLCLGVVDQDYLEAQKPRLPKHMLIMHNEFNANIDDQELSAYDSLMQKYYEERKHNGRSMNWSTSCALMLERQNQAKHIIDYLKAQGFEFF